MNAQHSKDGKRFLNISLAAPDQYLSFASFDTAAVPMTAEERGGRGCSFLGAHCPTEATEQSLLQRFLSPSDTVLETGARYGTTSCALAHHLGNSGRLVSVEPDPQVWNLLDENRHTHRCSFWLLRGAVAEGPVRVTGSMYSTRSVHSKASADTGGGSGRQSYTFERIQQVTNLSFTALLIDCEGCIESLFSGCAPLPQLLQGVRTIMLEGDMPKGAPDCAYNCVDYSTWIAKFDSMGLKLTHSEQDPVYKKIFHYVFQRNSTVPAL
ncbi:hypothetical protein B484DRAFT_398180 [Ochromonadaceae sp. CCMP2298]|nr:hypothetical protein B484DRAFT_398180 [Ochromonadaceae sp. CCMP2298]